jgi:hypothetical protein
VLFAVLVATRPLLARQAALASIDLAFLAAILWAAALEARRPRRGWPVLALLAVAGLLRPEAWLLTAAYALWLLTGVSSRREAALVIAAAAAAPLAWLAADLVVTGDPLFSLHGTRELAASLDRPRSLASALRLAPDYITSIVPPVVAWTGVLGALAALAALYERALLPLAVTALGFAAFLALGIAGLPVLIRYLLVPTVLLSLFAAVAVTGWRALPAGRVRSAWRVAGLVAALALLASVPTQFDDLRTDTRFTAAIHAVQSDLTGLLAVPAVRDSARRCPPVRVPDDRALPLAALHLDLPPGRVRADAAPGARGTVFLFATLDARRVFAIGSRARAAPAPGAAPRTVAANAAFSVSRSCR